MASHASKNPVKAAFKLVQQVWDRQITVTASDCHGRSVPFSFRYLEIIGNGTFGIVCRARDLDTNEIVAIKTVFQDEGHQNRELGIIKALDHPNIVGLKRYFYSKNENSEEFLSLVLEYMPTSLDRILKEYEKRKEMVPLHLVQMTMQQFMQALGYLHSLGICHRDIKPHNLLVDISRGVVKLCDFGCSKRLVGGEPNIQYICARYYRAPEIVFGWAHYTCAIDVWSAGCVMAEMFIGRPLFPGKNSIDQLAKIVKLLGTPLPEELKAMGQSAKKMTGANNIKSSSSKSRNLAELFPASIPAEALDFMLAMLRYDPQARISPAQAVQHPFFAVSSVSSPVAASLSHASSTDQQLPHTASNSASTSAVPPPSAASSTTIMQPS